MCDRDISTLEQTKHHDYSHKKNRGQLRVELWVGATSWNEN
jgi:hypothetical protein